MNFINDDIKYEILKLSNNKNFIFINKQFYNFIKGIRYNFLQKPLIINYQLVKSKQRFVENCSFRPSILLEPFKTLNLMEKENLGIKIYELDSINKKFKYNRKFEDLVIPLSFIKEKDYSPTYQGYVIYWEVNCVEIPDKERYHIYNLLF